MIRSIILLGICCFIFSCKNNPETSNQTPSNNTATTPPPEVGKQLYPSVPYETVKYLYDNCDYVDFIFYNQSFSMNRSQKGDVQNSISHISQKPAMIKTSCKSSGRVSFQVQGEIKLDAEIYVTPQCNYFIFMDGNTPKYANEMTPDGITFFNNVFNQVKGATQ